MSVNCSLDIAVSSANTGLDAIKRAPIVEHDTGIKCLRIQDVSQCKEYDNWGFTEVTPNNFSKFQLKKDDILIARTGGSIGVNRYISEDAQAVYNNGLIRIRVDTEKYYPKFVYYLLRTESFKQHINAIAFSTAAQPNMKIRDFLRFEFFDLELKQQIYIADMLSELDDKIELNRQTNQTLEQIAQAIFKSWFVDFEPVKAKIKAKQNGQNPERVAMRVISGKTDEELDQLSPEQRLQLTTAAALFPDELEESELGEIPKGWAVNRMKDLAEKITKGTTPRKPDVLNASDPVVIPFIKVKDITNDGEIIRGGLELIPTSIHENALKRSILKTNDLLFSIAGTIGRVSLVESDLDNSNSNQAVAFIRLKDCQNHLELCHQTLKSGRIQDEIASKVVQGVQANASLANIGDIKVIVPDQAVLEIWNQTIKPISNEKRNLSEQNRVLSQVRDSLLPILISGEISLDDTQSTAEAVA